MPHRLAKVFVTTVVVLVAALFLLTTLSAAHRKADSIRVQHQTYALTTKKPRAVHSVPSSPAPGRTAVIGANTPEQIPDDVATSLFLRVVARGAASNDRPRLNSYLTHVGVPPAANEAIISLAADYEHGVRGLNDSAAIYRGMSARLSAADATVLDKQKADLIASHRSSLIATVGSAEKWSLIAGNIKHKTTVIQ